MIRKTTLIADLKMISREGVLILFAILPLFIFFIFRVFIHYGVPLLEGFIEFDPTLYYGYFLALSLLMPASMLGTVCGFLMIDDRDAHIYELMSITPLGFTGYIGIRVFLPAMAAILYTFIGYLILPIYPIPLLLLFFISILNGITGIVFGLFLFTQARDKVKGLTLSKGLSILNILALADLLDLSWLRLLAALTPFYWIVRMVTKEIYGWIVIIALLVHLFWFFLFVRRSSKI